MTKLCICQICTCGRHRCPHNPRGNQVPTEPCTFSEYANRYIQHPLEPRKNYKPQDKPVASDAALDDKTTHKVDYIQHPLGERYVHEGEKYRPPEGEMDTTTNYTKDFTQKPLELQRPIRQQEAPKVLGKFEGEPTYQADYRKWDPQARELVKPDHSYVPNDAPFDDMTNYRNDFIPKQAGPRESMKPRATAIRSDQPFDDATEHNQAYIRHPLQAREQRKEEPYVPNTAPLDDLTTHKKDYTPKDGSRTVSFKPESNAYQSEAPFDGNTTHLNDYKKWDVEKPHQREPEAYQRPMGDMDMATTTHTDYTQKQIDRQLAKRPQEAPMAAGKFDDTTNYNTDFQKWAKGERAERPQQPGYQPNEAPFEGIPTYQHDYVPKRADMVRSLRPQDNPYKSNAPFEDATEYNKEYLRKYVPPCPVPVIENGQDIGYVYQEQDDVGHKWFDFHANEKYEAFKSGKMYGTLVK